ncbi:MAG: hypothetical protein WCL61_00930 [bacterium]
MKIYFSFPADVVRRATEQVLKMLMPTIEITENAEEAAVILISGLSYFKKTVYRPEKQYIVFRMERLNATINGWPENLPVVDIIPSGVEGLVEQLKKLETRFSNQTETAVEAIVEVPPLPSAKRILVIDDLMENIVSAKKCFAGHHLETVMLYNEAIKILQERAGQFDIVLTDLNLQMALVGPLSEGNFRPWETMPYGFMLAMEAARNGAKLVAVYSATNGNHHADAFSAAYGELKDQHYCINGTKVMLLRAQPLPDGSKDWSYAVAMLGNN